MATANPVAFNPYKPQTLPPSPPRTPSPPGTRDTAPLSPYTGSIKPGLAAPADPNEHRNFQSLRSPAQASGNGINVEPASQLLDVDTPISAHMSRSASDSIVASEPESSSMAPSRSQNGDRQSAQNSLAPAPSRARAMPPTPLDLAGSFATSTSYLKQSPGSNTRERLYSPSKFHFEVQQRTPPDSGPPKLNIVTDSSPKWTSGIDAKSEAFQRQAHGVQEDYDPANFGSKARSRSPFPSTTPVTRTEFRTDYVPHPLSVPAYNHPTRDRGHPAQKWTDSTAYWLGLYFFFNLGLTLFNKIVLVSFPFPYTLTGMHALSGCAGCYFALERGAFIPARLTQRETIILGAFSVLYTINIAVSNISLQLVTVPFHQVVRASTPLFTILISAIVLRTRFTVMKLVSLLPVVAGVGFATYGDYYFTAWGLILTLLGTFLAALKTVVTNLIQTGGGNRLKLHPLDLLMRMSPLAFVQCVVYGWYTGELERVRRYGATQMTRGKAVALLVNGVIACGLNIVSFTANKKAGPLTMTVSANCKQVLTIALAVVLFDLQIAPTNAIGILLTLIGGGWYGYVEYTEKKKKSVKLVDRT